MLVVEDQVEVVIHVSGKTRSRVSEPRDTGAGGSGGGGAGERGGATVYRWEGGAEGGVRAEPAAKLGGQASLISSRNPSVSHCERSRRDRPAGSAS